MRIIDTDKKQSIRSVDLYLTVSEARSLRQQLAGLLANAEAKEHFHIQADDHTRELSCSIVTARKLAEGSYTALERRVFSEP